MNVAVSRRTFDLCFIVSGKLGELSYSSENFACKISYICYVDKCISPFSCLTSCFSYFAFLSRNSNRVLNDTEGCDNHSYLIPDYKQESF